MEKEIKFIFFDLQCFLVITLLCICFFYNKILKTSKIFYIKHFAFLAFIDVIFFFNSIHFNSVFVFSTQLNNYSLLINFSFFSILFINQISSRIKWYLYLFFLLMLSKIVLLLFFSNDLDISKLSTRLFAINHFGLLIISISYMYYMVKEIGDRNLLKDPIFNFAIGVLLCSIISFPLVYFLQEIYKVNHDIITDNLILNSIPCIGYVIMYFFIIKGVLCLVRI